MADVGGPIVLDLADLTVSIDVSDSVALVSSEDGGDTPIEAIDIGAIWLPYVREQFIPSVVRQGDRWRKDPWNRFGGGRW